MKQSGVLQVPITPGMREDIDVRAGAEPGTIAYAGNLRFRQAGMAQRRLGTRELPNTSDATVTFPVATGYPPDFVAGFGQPVIGSFGYAHRFDETENGWRPAGLYSSAMPVRRLLTMYIAPGGSTHPALAGAATVAIDSAGYMLVAYCVNETVRGFGNICYAQYYDPEGNYIRGDQYSNTVRARAVAVGTHIYLVLQDSAATNAPVAAWDYVGGDIPFGSATTLVTLDAQADSWDVSPWPNASAANRWLIVWYDSSSTTVTVRRLNVLATEASVTFTPSGAPRIACYADTAHAWVGTVDDTSQAAKMYGYAWSGSWGSVIGPTNAWTFTAATMNSSPPIPGPSNVATTANFAGWVENADAALNAAGTYDYKSGDFTSGAVVQVRTDYNCYPISYPFGPDGEYVWADFVVDSNVANGGVPSRRRSALLKRWRLPSATNDSRAFVELTTARNAQYIDDGARIDRWTRPAQKPNGNWVMPIAVWIPDDSTGSIYYEFLEFEAPCQTTRTFAYAAGALTLPGQPVDLLPVGGYTGGVEVGVVLEPAITYLVVSGGGSLAAGEYKVCATYRWIDAAGRVRRSAPSAIATVTAALNDDMDIRVSTISCFRADLANVEYGQIELWVSPVNESLFYLYDDSQPARQAASYAAYTGVTYTTLAITARPQLPTDGGVQQNDMPMSGRCVVATETSLVVGVGWDRTIWQESKPIFPQEPANFSDFDAYKIVFPEETVAGAYMDGALIVFAERSIYAATGEGPTDTGSGGSRTVRTIVSGIGCSNERSVVTTPIGVFFESHRGIELMPRGLGAPAFVGAPVQDQLALRPTILDAAFHVGEDATTVRFLIEDQTATASTAPVFDAQSNNGNGFAAFTGIDVTATPHTIGSGSNRVLYVGMMFRVSSGSGPINSIALNYNGTPMTLVATSPTVLNAAGSQYTLYVYSLLEADLPAAGTYDINITTDATNGSYRFQRAAVSWSNALQTDPSVLFVSGLGDTVSTAQANPSPGLGLDFLGTSSTAVTPTATATQRSNGGAGQVRAAASSSAIAPSATLGWTGMGASTTWIQATMNVGAVPGEGNYGRKVLTYDIDAAAWSVDDYGHELGALGTTPQGLLFANESLSASPAFLLEDPTLATDDGVFFEGRLRLHTFYPVGYCGVTAYQATVARVSLDANPTTVNISVITDETNTKLGTVVGTDTASMKLYQLDPGNFSNKVTSIAIEAYDSTAGGATWHGFTIYHEPEPEMTHPSATTERI